MFGIATEKITTVGPENLLSEKAFGTEFTSGYSPYKWWKLDFNFNFFHADIDGSNIIDNYKAATYSWFARQTSRIMFAKNFDVQLRGNKVHIQITKNIRLDKAESQIG